MRNLRADCERQGSILDYGTGIRGGVLFAYEFGSSDDSEEDEGAMTLQENVVTVLVVWAILGAFTFGEEMDGPWHGRRFWAYLFVSGPFIWIFVGLMAFVSWVVRLCGKWRRS